MSIKQIHMDEEVQQEATSKYLINETNFQRLRDLQQEIFAATDVSPSVRKLVNVLIEQVDFYWQAQQLSIGTIKNRLAHLRTLCELIKKREIVPLSHDLGLVKRHYSTNQDKSQKCSQGQAKKLNSYRVQVQLELQRYFGLRHEECIKIKPHVADKFTHLALEGSWCKGGRSRTVPILTETQRYWLAEAKKLAEQSSESLIPKGQTYQQYSRYFYREIKQAGFNGSHGLRHAYAQRRYEELTGWACPAKGGPCSYELNKQQKEKDKQARTTISHELGHSREQITVNYIGR